MASTISLAGRGPSRSARRRTCWADSSAETSSTGAPAEAIDVRTWSSRVDLPDPGLAAQQGHRARDEPASEDPVELGQAGRDGPDSAGSTSRPTAVDPGAGARAAAGVGAEERIVEQVE